MKTNSLCKKCVVSHWCLGAIGSLVHGMDNIQDGNPGSLIPPQYWMECQWLSCACVHVAINGSAAAPM